MNASVELVAAPTEKAKRALYLSHFTPSMMPPETLEAMLVQREPLLTRVLGHLTESLRTGSRHHTLLVGPRGIGKTHLISLLHHRLIQTPQAKDKALIAWMREEEWGVTSFFELVLRILRTLDATYPEFNIAERTKPLYELKVDDAAKQAEALLLDVLAGKCLVVLMENLDDLFDQIGDQGQKAWRAFIQNHGNMILACTTPSLFAGVSIHKSPFYGFFDIEPLAELEFEDVVTLLRKIAIERGDDDLAVFIDTPEGRARIRAVHHLAEGNPRIYIIFAQFLNHEALDELVQAFMHTLDELTPYYQARIKELPGQQRKIAEYLVHYRGAATVKALAKACFISQQVCSSQLKQLKEKRYVRSIQRGRESYYELSEPLMRLCMEVKMERGEPINLFVEILRIWYTTIELSSWMNAPDHHRKIDLRYIAKALELSNGNTDDPKTVAAEAAIFEALNNGNVLSALEIATDMDAIGKSNAANWEFIAVCVFMNPSSIPSFWNDSRMPKLIDGLQRFLEKAVVKKSDRIVMCSGLMQSYRYFYGSDQPISIAISNVLRSYLARYPIESELASLIEFAAEIANGNQTTLATHQKIRNSLFDPLVPRKLSAIKRRIQRFYSSLEIAIGTTPTKDQADLNLMNIPIEERNLVATFFKMALNRAGNKQVNFVFNRESSSA